MRVCTLASGSSGNCIYVEGDEAAVLVDAGLSGKTVIEALDTVGIDPLGLKGILVTHEHCDHIKGVGILSRRFDLNIYATEKTWDVMGPLIGKIPEYNRCVFEPGDDLELGALKIEGFKTSHDAADSIGYSFYSRDYQVGVATDTGYLTSSARKYIDGSDLMIFEANHDLNMLKTGRYPWMLKKRILSDKGHLSNLAAAHCLASLVGGKTKGVILAHLSKENNSPELAFSTVSSVLEEAGVNAGDDFSLEVAPRSIPGTLWEFD